MSPSENNRSHSSFTPPKQTAPLRIQPERPTRRFWRRALRSLLWGGGVALFSFLLINLWASWRLHEELGAPIRLVQLAPPRVPDAENAAVVYLKAADALKLTDSQRDALHNDKGIARGGEAEATAEAMALSNNAQAIALTRQAAGMAACRFPVDYDAVNLAGILLPHLGKMRTLAYLIRAEALSEARSGHVEAALDDVSVLFRMSEHIAPEPMLISGLVAMAVERIGCRALADVLDTVSLTPEQAHAFVGRLAHTDWVATFQHDLDGERCFGMWAFQFVSNPIEARLLESGTPSTNIFTRMLGVVWAPLWKLDEIEYLHALQWQRAATLAPGAPAYPESIVTRDLPWYAVCTRIMLPSLARVGLRRDEMLVYRDMAQVALALNAYRTLHGRYPSHLEDAEALWGSAFPRDLYLGQPFVYRTEGDRLVLYSIGPNHKDDGGRKPPQSATSVTEREAQRQAALNGSTATQYDDIVWD